MQIVIDIPDTDYQVTLTKIMLACYGCEVTELPKEHGRLIDSDELSKRLLERWDIADKDMEKLVSNVMADIVCPIVIGTPTIIEKESEEEE